MSNRDPYSDLITDWEPISHRAETVGNKALLRRRLRHGGIDRFIIFCEILAKYRQGLGFICVPAKPDFRKSKEHKRAVEQNRSIPAAKRRKIAAQRTSPGEKVGNEQAPEGR